MNKEKGQAAIPPAFLRATLATLICLCGLFLLVPGPVAAGPVRVSTDSANQQDSALDQHAEVSADGRYVVFESAAADLVPNDANGATDVFRKDLWTGTILRISVDSFGVEGNGNSTWPRISTNGRYVVFESAATNLDTVTADTNSRTDIFLHDTQTGATTRVSIDGTTQGNNNSNWASVSSDGNSVAFVSGASNLIGTSDTNGQSDVFVKDISTGTITRVSTQDATNAQSDAASARPRISADGHYVVFASNATNLLQGVTTTGVREIYVKDRQTNATTRVTKGFSGPDPNGWSFQPNISADGRYVVFYSGAGNLVAGDTNSRNDVFLSDTVTGTVTLVSTDSSGALANNNSAVAGVSDDGRYVTFDSFASNLVANDTNGQEDVFVKDTWSGVTVRVSTDYTGVQGNGASLAPAISGTSAYVNGAYVVFESDASNLVTGDSNAVRDIFRADNPFPVIPPRVNLDADHSSGATPGDYATRFLVGNTASVAIADGDAFIDDGDSAQLSGLAVTLANPQGNDTLTTGNLYGGIQVDAASTSQQILLTGFATKAEYAATLKEITFSTDAAAPPGTRQVTVTATDDTGYSGVSATAGVAIAGGLTVAVDDNPYLVLASHDVSYTATVTNYDPADASGMTLTAILPADATFNGFLGAELADWDCNFFTQGHTAICSYLPVLAGGASASVSFDITTPADTGPLLAQFTVASALPDTYPPDNATTLQSVAVDYAADGFVAEAALADLGGGSGTQLFDHAGSAVALDGDFLAVGIPDYGAADSGAVYVWRRVNGAWGDGQLLQADLPLDGAHFGAAVALEGTTLVVGSPAASIDNGSVYVFGWEGNNWVQTERLVASESALDDEFGYALALQGNTLAVGAPGAPSYNQDAGHVYVFKRTASGFAESTILVNSVYPNLGRFGSALALDQGVLVAGAPGDAATTQPGSVSIFTESNGYWAPTQGLSSPIIASSDRFGRSVAIDAGHIVIGAEYDLYGIDSGAAHVYRYDTLTSSWVFEQRLDISATEISGFEEFGWSVDIQDDTIAVGAPYARTVEAQGGQAGATYVFQLDGGSWVQQQKFSNPQPPLIYTPPQFVESEFGTAVVLDGDTLAVGAPRATTNDSLGVDHGMALLARVGIDSAIKLSPLVDGGKFGTAVAMSGDTVLVGAPLEVNPSCGICGAVYFYQRSGSTWALQQRILAEDVGSGSFQVGSQAWFGGSVAIDGSIAVVGAYGDEPGAAALDSGLVYVFAASGGMWSLQQVLASPDPETQGDGFGYAVAVDGSTVVVGAPFDEDQASSTVAQGGAVHVFDYSSSWVHAAKLFGSLTQPYDTFGHALALDADTLVAGAPGYDDAAATQGIAYVFTRSTGWSAPQVIAPPAPVSLGLFGSSVAISRDVGNGSGVLLIGEPGADDVNAVGQILNQSGAVHRYLWTSLSWIYDQAINDDLNVTAQGDQFLGSALATDGETHVVGAPDSDDYTRTDAGAGFASDRYPASRIVAFDAWEYDHYGTAVAINNEAMLIGAPDKDGAVFNSNTGAVYLYPRFTTGSDAGGVYNGTRTVELTCNSCTSPGAEIWYTLDGSDPIAGGASSYLYTGAFEIDATKTLKYASFDSTGTIRETIKALNYVIDTTPPDAPVIGFPVLDNIDSFPPVPDISGTASDGGGSGVYLVQVAIQDATSGQYIVLDNSGLFVGMSATPKWNTATGTTAWSLSLATNPFAEAASYNLLVRAFDAVGNVSPVATSQFTYYTGTPAFMTLDLNLSASSILNVPGDDPGGAGEIDASVKLTEPGDLNADLSGSAITLEITDPNSVVTSLPLTTNSNGQQTVQGLGDATQIDFNVEGTWTLQAHFAGTLTRDPVSSSPKLLLVGQSAGSAVIVVGRIGSNAGLKSHNKTGKRIYDILIERGFQPQDIEFYSPDTNRDGVVDSLDGADCDDADGCNDAGSGLPNGIDGVPTLVASPTTPGYRNVQAAIEGMAALSNSNPAPRYVFMVDHGNTGQFLLNGSETIYPYDLDAWLDSQEGMLTGGAVNKPTVVVLGMCYSGSFLDSVAIDGTNNPSSVKRVVITSAADEESYKGTEESDMVRVGEFYVEEFVKEAGRGATLKAAHEYATEQTEIFTRKGDSTGPDAIFGDTAAQHPLLEDNGSFDPLNLAGNNRLGVTQGADGELADTLYLGVGPTYDATNAVDNPADIASVTNTVFLGPTDTTSLLTLAANDNAKVASAWVEIRAPLTDYVPSGGTLQLDPVLTRVILNPPVPGVLDDWYTSYNQFTTPGKYEIFYSVEDVSTHVISPIRRSVVYRNKTGNNSPTAPVLQLPVDAAPTYAVTEDAQLLFDWDASTDTDGDPITYTLEISTDNSFATVDYRREEILDSYAYVGPEGALKDNTIYFWRVIAVDAYGGTGTSSVFSFKTNETNVVRGAIFVTVTNSIPDATLAGAVVTAEKAGTTQLVAPLEGYYLGGGTIYRKYPADVYDVTISGVPGYDPKTDAGLDVSQQGIAYSTTLPAIFTDSDGDGLDDADEINIYGTNPNLVDTDGDGLVDGAGGIVSVTTYPAGVDTDGDGFVDGEQDFGNDPTVDDYADGNIAPYLAPDTVLNLGDYVVASRFATGELTVTPQALGHIDMNADGQVDAADLLLLMQAVQALP